VKPTVILQAPQKWPVMEFYRGFAGLHLLLPVKG
jgi:hypothetical protein